MLESIGPRVTLQVDNKLTDDDSKLNVELRFNHMDDFLPENLIHQVEPLKQLYEARQRLNDLLAKLDGNDDLEALLQSVASNTDELKKLQEQTAKAGEES